MKINRRKSLMAIIGGLFAPAVAQSKGLDTIYYGGQAVPQTGHHPPSYPYYGESAKTDSAPQLMENYLLKERTRLNKIINGELSEDYQEELENIRGNYNVTNQNIDALKSVSVVHRDRMKIEYMIEERKKSWIVQAIRQLKRLNSQTRKN